MSIRVTPQGPRELGYAEITAEVTQTGVGNTDVPGLSVTVTVGTRPIVVEIGGTALHLSSASGIGGLTIKEGSTNLASFSSVLSTTYLPVARKVRLAPSAGSHTYKVNIAQITAGNTILTAAADNPAYIHVYEV